MKDRKPEPPPEEPSGNYGRQFRAARLLVSTSPQFIDGQRGDGDFHVGPNGVIVDPGGAGFAAEPPRGNVSAEVVRRRLVVRGNAGFNHVQVVQIGRTAFRVTGLDDTTVNGQSAAIDLAGVKLGINIDTGDGDDEVRIGSAGGKPMLVGRLAVATGTGDDHIRIERLTTWRGNITTGSGRDQFEIIDSLLLRLFDDIDDEDQMTVQNSRVHRRWLLTDLT